VNQGIGDPEKANGKINAKEEKALMETPGDREKKEVIKSQKLFRQSGE